MWRRKLENNLQYPFFHPERRRWRWLWAVLTLMLLTGLGAAIWQVWPRDSFSGIKQENNIFQIFKATSHLKSAAALAPAFLGYDQPRVYLLLFLNNAEMRPGGGFIGSYGLVTLDKGKLARFETRGSENLDWEAPEHFKLEPPLPLKKYLRAPYWYFRDSNWSPDFPISARSSLWFYKAEGGKEAGQISGVIALTPRLIEELVKIIGPITVDDKVFTSENVVDELQYQVEVGFFKENKPRAERKALIGQLGRVILEKISDFSPWEWQKTYGVFIKMLEEKQMMIWSVDEKLLKILLRQDWAGAVKETVGDYLLVTDANMASLKTDPAVEREIFYRVKSENGRLKASLKVLYNHRGKFDWKTTRYRTYTRVYVPFGSELIHSEGFIDNDKKGEPRQIAPAVVSADLDKTVFGGFMSIEPGTQHQLILEYYLPETINKQVVAGQYSLLVQKQLGAPAYGLTVEADFGKTVGQGKEKFYQKTDLRMDREFRY